MYQFIKPKFRFGLFVIEGSKNYFPKNNNFTNSTSTSTANSKYLPIVCYADTYEIKEDGSIVFYQTVKVEDDKKFKVPVLSYPNGKWEACVLLDELNDFPVFKGHAVVHNNNLNKVNDSQLQESVMDEELNQFNENFSTNTKTYNHINIDNQEQQLIKSNFGQTTNNGMTGITSQYNPEEFKKQKESWLENQIKQYIKEEELFVIKDFLFSVSKQQQIKTFKITESDIIWSSSKLIRNKDVMSRKFSEPNTQKILSLILPDIMKRQWDGKIAPILQILQEREETKNTTAIDLAVWMSQNNY